MGIRNYTNTGATSTLTASIGATDTSITLNSYSGDPTPPFTAALARGTATEEVVLVTAVTGSTVTVTRGYDGTNAQAQGAGSTFQEVVIAQDFREANNHVNATASAHGTTSQLVGVSDAQTLTNKTLTSPSIASATLTGTTTAATLNVTTLSVSGATTVAGLTNTGNQTISGTLGVTGATTLGAVTASSASVTGTLGVTGAATLTGGATVPTGAKVTLTDAPVAGTDGANKTYVDGLTAQTSASRKLPTFWGSGATFPTTNVLAGDEFYRSDLAAEFVNVGGTAWQQTGVPVYATNTARDGVYTTAVKPNIPEGFRIWHSGLKVEQRWDATNSKWRFRTFGSYGGTTDANGMLTIAHSGGQAPDGFAAFLVAQNTDDQDLNTEVIAWSSDATNVIVRFVRTNTHSYYGSNPLNVAFLIDF